MISKSRAAHENLERLEKLNAPFKEQLDEAAKFIGLKFRDNGHLAEHNDESEKLSKLVPFKREEWLLIWLSKKLKSEQIARKLPSSWWLFSYLIETLPLRCAARILSNKEVIVEGRDNPSKQKKASILERTLEEANSLSPLSQILENGCKKSLKKLSKKRKHPGELIPADDIMDNLPDLMDALSTVMRFVVNSGSVIAGLSVYDMGESLSAAYMKTAYITSAEKAAIIFGSWIALCEKALPSTNYETKFNSGIWLTPFIELWNSRLPCNEACLSFSAHCALPALSLLQFLRKRDREPSWQSELERLIARNVVTPAKIAYLEEKMSDLPELLIKNLLVCDNSNAPIIYEIFIRSIQIKENGRRRPDDEAWLLKIFKSLIKFQQSPKSQEYICNMLHLSVINKVNLDLDFLRSIALKYALPECEDEDWEMIANLIDLNANVFMIPNEDKLMDKLLERITTASLKSSWISISDQVVSQILVPIMKEFAKARDLTGFIRNWYFELSKFESSRKNIQNDNVTKPSAWEDEGLCSELGKLLEPSLTINQIMLIIDWVSEKVDENLHAACVILDAISGSVSGQEDIVDSISLRPYRIIFDQKRLMKLETRYRWRAWRILTHVLNWANIKDLSELARLWEAEENPFTWSPRGSNSLLASSQDEHVVDPESLEIFRSACAAFNFSTKESRMESFIKPIIIRHIQLMSIDVCKLHEEFYSNGNLNSKTSQAVHELSRCVFTEYPETLILGLELNGEFEKMLHAIFDFAAESFVSPCSVSDRLQLSADAYPNLWTVALQSDEVLNNQKLTDILIDIMLSKCTLTSSQSKLNVVNNAFTIHCLNQMAFEVVHKNIREKIMRSWLSLDYEDNPDLKEKINSYLSLDPAVLALKRRIMKQHPNLYEGVEFDSIITLADALADKHKKSNFSQLNTKLSLLKDIAQLTIIHALTNLDQEKRKHYLIKAFKTIENRVRNSNQKKKNHLNFAFISISEVILVEFSKKKTSLHEIQLINKENLEDSINFFKEQILIQLNIYFSKFFKGHGHDKGNSGCRDIRIYAIINSLTALGVTASQLVKLKSGAQKITEEPSDIGRRIDTFMTLYCPNEIGEKIKFELDGSVASLSKRVSIEQITKGIITTLDDEEKLRILRSLIEEYHLDNTKLDKIFAARFVVISIKDTKPNDRSLSCSSDLKDSEAASDNEAQFDFDLTSAYILMSLELRKVSDIIPFCIISETMELILTTKARCISQYAIDSTLGTISIICSPRSSHLPATRSGTIFLHLTNLLRSVLTHHRLKLKGHFSLVQLSMQGLLRCLFHQTSNFSGRTPGTNIIGFSSTPMWLTSPRHQLDARHAESYTRLLTLINDPSASSVQGIRHNNLVSATNKWKRMSSFFMRAILIDYIKWQLEFSQLPEIKEKLQPGLHSLLDNTTLETRRIISAELNASGRAIFATLYRDYQKFGKWNGTS